jgi:PAS domain S-box-containing protein
MCALRILIVDDRGFVRQSIRRLLSARIDLLVCGEAEDGIQAVERAKSLRPDVILMDVSMPRMDGFQATKIIRREVPESQVVIVSQNERTFVGRQTCEAGAAAFVAKSDLGEELIPTLDRLSGHQKAAQSGDDMREYPESRVYDPAESSEGDASVPVESILCTEDLDRRPARVANYENENRALVALAQALADSPHTVLQTLADTLLDVCEAGSAGISLLSTDDGGKRFYWPAIAGRWKSHIGGGTPRDFGPCGDVLDRNTPLLFGHVERRYTYFKPVLPPVEEALLVPFHVGGKAVGTIWAVAHDDHRKFDAEDLRIMSSLGTFASSAYQVLLSLDALKSEEAERKKAERASGLLAAIVSSSDDAIISKGLDGIITSWNNGAERLFGYTAEEAVGQPITLIIPVDRRGEEVTILARIRRGERIDHFETLRLRKDGIQIELSLTISPVKDTDGHIVGASKVARDISRAKQVERALRESEDSLRALSDGLEIQVRARTQELEQRNWEILQQAEQLRQLSNRLLKTQDDERRHIARELHDSAGQIITALGMNVAGLNRYLGTNPALFQTLGETQSLIQQLSKEIRTTSYLLHPPLLDESGLSEAIRWYIQGLMERSGLAIDLDISDDFGRLPQDLELAVFRIVQEALTNIHRHSCSKTATIRLSHNGDSVLLEIQDHGQGISPEKLVAIKAQRTGVGIAGMRERVRQCKGEMDVRSDSTGSTISVTLPVATVPSSRLEGISQ